MNKRTVLELARVAGLTESMDEYNQYWTADDTDTLERFAKLIAEHACGAERERIVDLLLDMHAKEERHNYYLFIANIIKESA